MGSHHPPYVRKPLSIICVWGVHVPCCASCLKCARTSNRMGGGTFCLSHFACLLSALRELARKPSPRAQRAAGLLVCTRTQVTCWPLFFFRHGCGRGLLPRPLFSFFLLPPSGHWPAQPPIVLGKQSWLRASICKPPPCTLGTPNPLRGLIARPLPISLSFVRAVGRRMLPLPALKRPRMLRGGQ